MCKSENQPGGPYRCSGDMAKNYDAAVTGFGKALEGTSAPSQDKFRTEGDLARVDAQIAAVEAEDDSLTKTESLDTLRDARAHREGEHATAQAAFDTAQSRLRANGKKMTAARDNYDATPRGLADLQREIDTQPEDRARMIQESQQVMARADRKIEEAEAAPADPVRDQHLQRLHQVRAEETAKVSNLQDAETGTAELTERRDAALAQMNQEATQRDQRWGSVSGEHVPINRRTDHPGEQHKNVYADLAQNDQISASSIDGGYYLDNNGTEGTAHTVTFYRPTVEDGEATTKTMTARIVTPTGSDSPSQADALAKMSDRAAAFESSKNLAHHYRRANTSEEDRPAAKAEYEEGRRYAKQLRGFLGDRAGGYLGEARRQQGATPMQKSPFETVTPER